MEHIEPGDYIEELQKEYVLVPTDEAASNISVVCKKYYLEVLRDELENTPSYERVDRSSEDIIRQHEEEMYDGPIDDETRKLPYHVYWLPKQHKTPPKSRFVVSGKYCTTGICLTEWPKKRKVSQNHKTHFIPVFIS